jgi:putative tricarboxylic transport membrane protein
MASPIRSSKDLLTGLIYVGIGAGAVLIATVGDYKVGTAIRMGPAYFPLILSAGLILIGLISIARSFIQPGTPVGVVGVKGMLLVAGSIVLFGLTVRGAGLIVALPMMVIVSSFASRPFSWARALILAAGLTTFCTLVFLKGLGVPLPLIGSWLGG